MPYKTTRAIGYTHNGKSFMVKIGAVISDDHYSSITETTKKYLVPLESAKTVNPPTVINRGPHETTKVFEEVNNKSEDNIKNNNQEVIKIVPPSQPPITQPKSISDLRGPHPDREDFNDNVVLSPELDRVIGFNDLNNADISR